MMLKVVRLEPEPTTALYLVENSQSEWEASVSSLPKSDENVENLKVTVS